VNEVYRRLAGTVCRLVLFVALAGCSASAHGQPSAVQSAFDSFESFQRRVVESDLPTQAAASKILDRYRATFSPYQTEPAIAKLENNDLALLFRAADSAFFYSVSPDALHHMQLDLTALQQRGIARKEQYENVYAALIENRSFDQARAFVTLHPLASAQTVPRVVDAVVHEGPTTLRVKDGGKRLERTSVDLASGQRIVVVASPLCHFCQRAIRSIEADAVLRPLFRDHALWLVPPDESTSFVTVADWNRVHPGEQMEFAYRRGEWPMVERWETPVFYFLKDGVVVGKVTGWPKAGRKAEIKRSLARGGFISSPRTGGILPAGC
jgi:hypothetical protein